MNDTIIVEGAYPDNPRVRLALGPSDGNHSIMNNPSTDGGIKVFGRLSAEALRIIYERTDWFNDPWTSYVPIAEGAQRDLPLSQTYWNTGDPAHKPPIDDQRWWSVQGRDGQTETISTFTWDQAVSVALAMNRAVMDTIEEID